MAYGNFKDLSKRTASDKILHDKVQNIAKSPMDVNEVLLQRFINFLIRSYMLFVQINLQMVVLKMQICQNNN